jgi:hypothetical protein
LTVGPIFGLSAGFSGGLSGERRAERWDNYRADWRTERRADHRAVRCVNRGGSAVIKHYALRLILLLKGYTPLRFIDFLDHCARLILLKKVGGGYIFIHRMLLEYFAEMTVTFGIISRVFLSGKLRL